MYWFSSSDQDWITAKSLMKLKRYHHSLFFCHLTLEKLLKGKIVEVKDQSAPQTHDLLRLAKILQVEMNGKLETEFKEINRFNLEARYDDYKLQFYKLATKTYTEKWFEICRKIRLWIKKI